MKKKKKEKKKKKKKKKNQKKQKKKEKRVNYFNAPQCFQKAMKDGATEIVVKQNVQFFAAHDAGDSLLCLFLFILIVFSSCHFLQFLYSLPLLVLLFTFLSVPTTKRV